MNSETISIGDTVRVTDDTDLNGGRIGFVCGWDGDDCMFNAEVPLWRVRFDGVHETADGLDLCRDNIDYDYFFAGQLDREPEAVAIDGAYSMPVLTDDDMYVTPYAIPPGSTEYITMSDDSSQPLAFFDNYSDAYEDCRVYVDDVQAPIKVYKLVAQFTPVSTVDVREYV